VPLRSNLAVLTGLPFFVKLIDSRLAALIPAWPGASKHLTTQWLNEGRRVLQFQTDTHYTFRQARAPVNKVPGVPLNTLVLARSCWHTAVNGEEAQALVLDAGGCPVVVVRWGSPVPGSPANSTFSDLEIVTAYEFPHIVGIQFPVSITLDYLI